MSYIVFHSPYINRPGSMITMVADVLVPNKHQGINNKHAESTVTILSHEPYAWLRNLYDATPIKHGVRERSGVANPLVSLLLAGSLSHEGIALGWGKCNGVYEYIFHHMFINITVAWTWRTELIIYVGEIVLPGNILLYDVLSFNECQRGSQCER